MPFLSALTERLLVAPEVTAALAEGRPVVALESTLISHGLPYPVNLEVAMASEAAVRETDGAVPATVAIRDGRVLVGLDEAALEALATAPAGTVRKASRPSLAVALGRGWLGRDDRLDHDDRRPCRGHHGPGHRRDRRRAWAAAGRSARSISRRTSRSWVGRRWPSCAPGPKAILDVPATLEYLETRGVPVIAVGQPELPGFYARSAGIAAPHSVEDVAGAAAVVGVHLGLGLGSGVLVCVPVPRDVALPEDVARDAVERATAEAEAAGTGGPALTPWLLARIAEITGGASVRANTALIVNDARVAGELAARLA